MTVLDFSPSTIDLVLYQGDDCSKTFRLGSTVDDVTTYWDLTGWSGASQLRAKANSDTVLASFNIEFGEGQDTDEGAGFFTISLSAEDSQTLPKRCFWDLELINGEGLKKTYFAGAVTVKREVTHD